MTRTVASIIALLAVMAAASVGAGGCTDEDRAAPMGTAPPQVVALTGPRQEGGAASASASAPAPAAPSASTSTSTSTTTTTTGVAGRRGGGKGAPPAPAAACGDKPLAPCPLYGWMRANASPPMMAEDLDGLALALDKVVDFAPPGYTNWQSIARDGASAARGQSLDGVKAACRSCHKQYKDRYKGEMRDRAI